MEDEKTKLATKAISFMTHKVDFSSPTVWKELLEQDQAITDFISAPGTLTQQQARAAYAANGINPDG